LHGVATNSFRPFEFGEQRVEMQSSPVMQFCPFSHPWPHAELPQSTSVSAPSCTPF
jgi:hypothetical protein